ncbi:hypothetical protein BDZ89DRAFT_1068171 [Hymenopellis radicata]|nr:hypothetical protein BDZ89DRAFT_1068171 [Hymenopellis radicata]
MIFKTISNMLTKRIQPQPRLHTSTGSFEGVPQELVDLIISYLVYDTAALLSCALVHTTWTRTSRHYLPSLTLVVSCPSRASELAKVLCSPRDTLSPSIAAIEHIGWPYTSLFFDDDTGNVLVIPGTPRPYRKLIRALKHDDNTKTRWRMMLWLASYRPGCIA